MLRVCQTCSSHEFYCILTKVHELGHMLGTCCYAKTSGSTAYAVHMSTDNNPSNVLQIAYPMHMQGTCVTKTCSCSICWWRSRTYEALAFHMLNRC